MGTQPVTVGDLLKALERVEIWIRDIRGALGQMDTRQALPQPLPILGAAPPMAQGSCPPPLPDDDDANKSR